MEKETRLTAYNCHKLVEGESYQVRVGLGGVVMNAVFLGAVDQGGLRFQDEDGVEWTARVRKGSFVARDMVDGRQGAPVSIFGF